MKFNVVFDCLSNVGAKRDENQDSTLLLNDYGIIAVADGMGGHLFGAEASSLAVKSVKEWFVTFRKNNNFHTNDLATSFRFANKKVYNSLHLSRSGTTLVALHILQDMAVIANSGDSRCYIIRDEKIKQITDDHSVVNELLKEHPEIDPMRIASLRNQITNAIGLKIDVKVDEFVVKVRYGDVFLLCSDGLTNEVSDEEILKILISSKKSYLYAICESLISAANKHGGNDNITVALVRIL